MAIGIIGGSGVYQIDGLENARWQDIDTPWGAPTDQLLSGRLAGVDFVFLPRHGRGHVHTPSTVNYRANIAALKQMGCDTVVAVSAVGSLREDYRPGDVVLVDQFIDRSFAREKSFFGPGCVGHVSLADPVCAALADALAAAARGLEVTLHRGGTYLAMEGPQFSTRAESALYRQWGCSVIGMTGMPEAKLAREAELHYATLAMVTDYDCWHEDHDAVDVAQVVATLTANSHNARTILSRLPAQWNPASCRTGCAQALDHAIMTAPKRRDPAICAQLATIAGRVLGAAD